MKMCSWFAPKPDGQELITRPMNQWSTTFMILSMLSEIAELELQASVKSFVLSSTSQPFNLLLSHMFKVSVTYRRVLWVSSRSFFVTFISFHSKMIYYF